MEPIILGTFCSNFAAAQRKSRQIYDLSSATQFFIFLTSDDKFLLTFSLSEEEIPKVKNKISFIRFHRKHKFNTLYTINGLNMLTKKNPDISWENYKNSCILAYKNQVSVLLLTLVTIINAS